MIDKFSPPEELVAYLKSLEATYPALEHVH